MAIPLPLFPHQKFSLNLQHNLALFPASYVDMAGTNGCHRFHKITLPLPCVPQPYKDSNVGLQLFSRPLCFPFWYANANYLMLRSKGVTIPQIHDSVWLLILKSWFNSIFGLFIYSIYPLLDYQVWLYTLTVVISMARWSCFWFHQTKLKAHFSRFSIKSQKHDTPQSFAILFLRWCLVVTSRWYASILSITEGPQSFWLQNFRKKNPQLNKVKLCSVLCRCGSTCWSRHWNRSDVSRLSQHYWFKNRYFYFRNEHEVLNVSVCGARTASHAHWMTVILWTLHTHELKSSKSHWCLPPSASLRA